MNLMRIGLKRTRWGCCVIRLSEIESALAYCESGPVAGGGGMRVAFFRLGGVDWIQPAKKTRLKFGTDLKCKRALQAEPTVAWTGAIGKLTLPNRYRTASRGQLPARSLRREASVAVRA